MQTHPFLVTEASSKHPQKMHRHNIEKVKRDSVELSNGELNSILDAICNETDSNKISVTSTVPQKRKSRIYADAGEPIPSVLSHQILPNGVTVTEKVEFDGVESKTFDGILQFPLNHNRNHNQSNNLQ